MRRVHEQSRCAGALARRFVDSVLGSACSGWCGCRMSVWAGCFDFAGLNLPGGISCLGEGGPPLGYVYLDWCGCEISALVGNLVWGVAFVWGLG